MECLVCKGPLWKQAHLNLYVCQTCGLVYAKPPGITAELAVADHRHDGLFPVGEPTPPPGPTYPEWLVEQWRKEREDGRNLEANKSN
jgi:hypothetical protein